MLYSSHHQTEFLADSFLNLSRNIDVLSTAMTARRNLNITLLDVASKLVKTRSQATSLPRRNTTVEHLVHLLKRLALGLGSGQEHVDKGEGVEGAEDHVHLPVDGPQKRWDGEGENAVPCPVASGGKRHGLRANLGGEDLGGVCPGGRAPGGGEGCDKEVRAGDDALGDCAVLLGNDPRNILVFQVGVGVAIRGLQSSGGEKLINVSLCSGQFV